MSRKVLIVDDEAGIRQALGQLLEFEGYEVRSADNATDGITQYQSFRPHLVFLDVKMAGIDGLEALKRLREIDPLAVVVMISGHATMTARGSISRSRLRASRPIPSPSS